MEDKMFINDLMYRPAERSRSTTGEGEGGWGR